MNYFVGRGEPCPQHGCANPNPHAHMGGKPEAHEPPEPRDTIDLSPLIPAGTWSKTVGPATYVIEIHQLDGLVPMTKAAAHHLHQIPDNTGSTILWWPLEKVRGALHASGWRVIA